MATKMRVVENECAWGAARGKRACVVLHDGSIEVDGEVVCEGPKQPVWRELHAALQDIAKRRSALDAEEAEALVRAEAIGIWRRLGYAHMGEYLERELGYGPKVGMERLRVARALIDLPLAAECLGNGMHYSAIRELTRVMTPATERDWLDFARGKNLRQIEAAVSGRKLGDRPEDPANPDLMQRDVSYRLSPHVIALIREIRAEVARELGHRVDDDVLFETLCRRARAGGDAGGKPAYQIGLTVCSDCKRGWQTSAGRAIEVSAAVIERADCDAEHLGSLDAEKPARVTTSIPPRTRKQVLARDRGCTVPGCRASANVDVHHIKRRAHGGGHQPSNLTVLCSAHHQHLHEGLLTMTGHAPDAIAFEWTQPPADTAAATLVEDDARAALTNLGFRPCDARDAVALARPHVGSRPQLEALIREALKRCVRHAT